MSANEAGWLLALLWGLITTAMLIVGGITGDFGLVFGALLPGTMTAASMWWAEENA